MPKATSEQPSLVSIKTNRKSSVRPFPPPFPPSFPFRASLSALPFDDDDDDDDETWHSLSLSLCTAVTHHTTPTKEFETTHASQMPFSPFPSRLPVKTSPVTWAGLSCPLLGTSARAMFIAQVVQIVSCLYDHQSIRNLSLSDRTIFAHKVRVCPPYRLPVTSDRLSCT